MRLKKQTIEKIKDAVQKRLAEDENKEQLDCLFRDIIRDRVEKAKSVGLNSSDFNIEITEWEEVFSYTNMIINQLIQDVLEVSCGDSPVPLTTISKEDL